jgi:hypothetical protein
VKAMAEARAWPIWRLVKLNMSLLSRARSINPRLPQIKLPTGLRPIAHKDEIIQLPRPAWRSDEFVGLKVGYRYLTPVIIMSKIDKS